MIGRRGERGSGISVLAVRHDDDDDLSHTYEEIETRVHFCNESVLFVHSFLYRSYTSLLYVVK